MDVRPAPSTWKWPQGVTGWMLFDGERQVAWFADEDEARTVADFLDFAKKTAPRKLRVTAEEA